MKKLVLIIGGVVAITLFSATLPCGNQVFAISGCCMERQTLKSRWIKNKMNIRECKKRNRPDRDNIFNKAGLIWWNQKCK